MRFLSVAMSLGVPIGSEGQRPLESKRSPKYGAWTKYDLWALAASSQGVSLSEWIEAACDQALIESPVWEYNGPIC